uniref:Transmembrane protein 100 n=1 Tax=Amphiprion ocellaris TaxID=80972 RepID=A0A3Q1AKM3_AMPOC
MTTKMETLDPAALPASTVTFDPKAEAVTLPGGVVSVAGVAVVTGGVELSCSSCMLAFCFWGTLIGLSCVAVGLQLRRPAGGTSHLLALGLIVMAISFTAVVGVATFHLLTRKRRAMTRAAREEGKEVLVESGRVIKKVTV